MEQNGQGSIPDDYTQTRRPEVERRHHRALDTDNPHLPFCPNHLVGKHTDEVIHLPVRCRHTVVRLLAATEVGLVSTAL